MGKNEDDGESNVSTVTTLSNLQKTLRRRNSLNL